MAYSNGAQVIMFDGVLGAGVIAVASSTLDFSDDGIDDVGVILCPLPLMVYGCGIYVNETLGSTLAADLVLETSTVIAGTDVTVATWDLDAVTNFSGSADDGVGGTVASDGAERMIAGDVAWMNASQFPTLIRPGRVLTLKSIDQGAIAGEVMAFVYAKWMAMDFRPDNMWVNQA